MGDFFQSELDAGWQGSPKKRGCLLQQCAHLHRADTRVGPPPKCEDVVDQIAASLRRAPYFIDVLRGLCSMDKLRLDHFRIAENGANDVVEVMRNPACKRSDHLHATRPLEPHRQSRPLALV